MQYQLLTLLAILAGCSNEINSYNAPTSDGVNETPAPVDDSAAREDDDTGGVGFDNEDLDGGPILGWVGTVEAMLVRLTDEAARGQSENDDCVGTFVLERQDSLLQGAAGCSSRTEDLDIVGTLEGRLDSGRLSLDWTFEVWETELSASTQHAVMGDEAEILIEVEAQADGLSLLAVLRGQATVE